MSSSTHDRCPDEVLSRVVAAVDDDPFMLRALGRTLGSAGYRTLLFDNPWTALSGIPAAHVDLVILNRHMPGRDGPSLARRLRQRWEGSGPPLVLLGADLDGLSAADAALFDRILAKPIRPDDLLDAIRRPRRESGYRLRTAPARGRPDLTKRWRAG